MPAKTKSDYMGLVISYIIYIILPEVWSKGK